MAKVQLFWKTNSNLEEYKLNFKKALSLLEKYFPSNVLEFLNTYIEKQTSYVEREDVENLYKNALLLEENEEFRKYFLWEKWKMKKNWNILEYSFNLISLLNDKVQEFEKSEKLRKKQEKLKKEQEIAKQKNQAELDKLESLLDNL